MLQVSGEISLACSWRVTPLDVVTMKVKQQQAEVDHKEEILALLQVILPHPSQTGSHAESYSLPHRVSKALHQSLVLCCASSGLCVRTKAAGSIVGECSKMPPEA